MRKMKSNAKPCHVITFSINVKVNKTPIVDGDGDKKGRKKKEYHVCLWAKEYPGEELRGNISNVDNTLERASERLKKNDEKIRTEHEAYVIHPEKNK